MTIERLEKLFREEMDKADRKIAENKAKEGHEPLIRYYYTGRKDAFEHALNLLRILAGKS